MITITIALFIWCALSLCVGLLLWFALTRRPELDLGLAHEQVREQALEHARAKHRRNIEILLKRRAIERHYNSNARRLRRAIPHVAYWVTVELEARKLARDVT